MGAVKLQVRGGGGRLRMWGLCDSLAWRLRIWGLSSVSFRLMESRIRDHRSHGVSGRLLLWHPVDGQTYRRADLNISDWRVGNLCAPLGSRRSDHRFALHAAGIRPGRPAP